MNNREKEIVNSFIEEIASVKVHKTSKHGLSLKKPLLLLLLIAKIEKGEIKQNKIYYCDVEQELSALIEYFGNRPALKYSRPDQPFFHLSSSSFWILNLPDGIKADFSKTLPLKVLKDPDTYGYFEPQLFCVIYKYHEARMIIVNSIINCWFPKRTGDNLLSFLGLCNRKKINPEINNKDPVVMEVVEMICSHSEQNTSNLEESTISRYGKNINSESKENGREDYNDQVSVYNNKDEERISYEEFFKRAILRLRNPSKSKGIHSVYSGFNTAFRDYYNEDPVAVMQDLARKGIIEIRYRKGGAMIYLPGEAPTTSNTDSVLRKILSDDRE